MKAQFLSFDAIFAIVIFTFAVSLLAFVWYDVDAQISVTSVTSSQNMQAQTQTVAERLLLSGFPSNWNAVVSTNSSATWANVSVGLGNGAPGNLSIDKVLALAAMANDNYQSTKPLLGVSYDYYIVIKGSNFYIPIGAKPSVVNLILTQQVTTRPVTINGAPAQMQVFIWTNSTFGVS
jgi:hypothetical protein